MRRKRRRSVRNSRGRQDKEHGSNSRVVVVVVCVCVCAGSRKCSLVGLVLYLAFTRSPGRSTDTDSNR